MQTIDVSAGLLFRDRKLLIAQRQPDSHLGGLWEFPGGKREAGETFEQCLARELHEELGVPVKVGELYESITHTYSDRTVCLKFFLCHLPDGEPRAVGCAALKWISCGELKHFSFPPADAQLLTRLARDGRLWSEAG